MEGYFDHRASLAGLILIIDIRRKLTAEDRAMLSQAGELKVPVHVLINKADKLAFGARKQAFMHFSPGTGNGGAICATVFCGGRIRRAGSQGGPGPVAVCKNFMKKRGPRLL